MRSIPAMIGSRSSHIRRCAQVAFVAVFSTLLLAATGTAAHADTWVLRDGFEVNPTGTWTIETYGESYGSFLTNAPTAHSGSNYVWLSAGTQFVGVGRPVRIPSTGGGPCWASVYIRTVYAGTVNFEVIDAATWTYRALKQVSLSPSGYQKVSVGTFYSGDVYVRVSLLGTGTGSWSGVRVDDLEVSCEIIR